MIKFRLTLPISVHFRISESWQASWCWNISSQSVCRVSFFVIAGEVPVFLSYSRSVASLLSELWWEEAAGAHLPFLRRPAVVLSDQSRWRREDWYRFLSVLLAGTQDRNWDVRDVMTLPLITVAENQNMQRPFPPLTCWLGSWWWSRLGTWY